MSTVLISAGEASGDIYGAELTRELKKSGHRVIAFGGPEMAKAGAEVMIELTKFAVVGFVEVMAKLPGILASFNAAKKIIMNQKPDILVVIDYPGFNLKLIKEARKLGVKRTIYFITPQVWAWKYKRIFKIKKYCDLVINVLPFEKKIFEDAGIKARYFGHPLTFILDKITEKNKEIKQRENLVGIFPGSRESEIKIFFQDVLDSCDELNSLVPNVKFLVFRAQGVSREFLEKSFSKYPKFKYEITEGGDYASRKRLAAAIAKSGTTTLELALLGVPQAVVYKVNKISFLIAGLMINRKFLKYISLPNIIMGREIVREFIQNKMHPGAIALETARLLKDFEYRSFIMNEYVKLKKMLDGGPSIFADIVKSIEGKDA